ncbi:hypothetical protein JTB14_001484 [Gonioctena quinquepunctata]|nr:hypothetical protein JTB14_001484 [Gonioctena quinquepunctata]
MMDNNFVGKNSNPRPENFHPVHDDITNEMLRNLTHGMKITLLQINTDIFQQTTYPRQCKEANIVPIPQEEKVPSNYRPRNLTCCIGKATDWDGIRKKTTRPIDFNQYFGDIDQQSIH